MIEIKTTTTITAERLSDLFCTGLEGGYSPWLGSMVSLTPYEPGLVWYGRAEYFEGFSYQIEATFDDGDNETVTKIIFACDVVEALQLMAEKEPQAFHDFIEENDDAGTGDVFLQLLCLGEVIYV